MPHTEVSLEDTLKLLEQLAQQSLALWDIPANAKARLINVSENATYLVEADGYKAILRIHRENYHTEKAIESELAWADALRNDKMVETPGVYTARDGKRIQSGIVDGLPAPRFMVLFHFVEGNEPDETGDLIAHYETLGAIAARTHVHSIKWQKPIWFERLTWDEEAVFGVNPTWGSWRDGPDVTPEIAGILSRVEVLVIQRLQKFGKGPERYGLIHADMRLANLLVDGDETELIDFDDCGKGWLLYDFASAISFIEDDPRIPEMKMAWVKGYRTVRSLTPDDIQEIDSFIMLRRMALLAWIGSHIEAPEPQALAPGFAQVTADIGLAYLANYAAFDIQT